MPVPHGRPHVIVGCLGVERLRDVYVQLLGWAAALLLSPVSCLLSVAGGAVRCVDQLWFGCCVQCSSIVCRMCSKQLSSHLSDRLLLSDPTVNPHRFTRTPLHTHRTVHDTVQSTTPHSYPTLVVQYIRLLTSDYGTCWPLHYYVPCSLVLDDSMWDVLKFWRFEFESVCRCETSWGGRPCLHYGWCCCSSTVGVRRLAAFDGLQASHIAAVLECDGRQWRAKSAKESPFSLGSSTTAHTSRTTQQRFQQSSSTLLTLHLSTPAQQRTLTEDRQHGRCELRCHCTHRPTLTVLYDERCGAVQVNPSP